MNKRKRNNAVQNALTALYGQMFPGGKQQQEKLVLDLYVLFNERLQIKSINQALCFILSSIILMKIKNRKQMFELMDKRLKTNFTLAEKNTILEFALINNKLAALHFNGGANDA